MAAYPSMAYPATPSKRDDSVEKIIQKLNDDYGLDIRLPDSSLTPSRRKQLSEQDEQYARWDRICRGIRFLYYQCDGTLDNAIETFFNEAKASSLRWVPKPRADSGTLPSPNEPPKARTPGQRWNLQTILINILDEFKAQKAPALLIPKRNTTVTGPRRNPNDDGHCSPIQKSPESAGSKRSFDSDDGQAFKRIKARKPSPPPHPPSASVLSFENALGFLDNVPSRQRPGLSYQSARKSASTRGRIEVEDAISVRTSVSSHLSNVFSYHDGPSTTQTTIEASSQEKRRAPVIAIREVLPPMPAPAPLPVSNPSTTPPPAIVPQPHARKGTVQDPYPPSPSVSSAFSDFSDLDDVVNVDATPPSVPDQRVRPEDRPVNGGNTALQARLCNIWPKFPRWLHEAPLAVAWEITRICLHCDVDLDDRSLRYNPAWATADVVDIWRSLAPLDVFQGKQFPERPSAEVFAAALASFECRGHTVVMSASLEFNPDKTGPMFLVDMKPLRFDEGCRLTRRFGPDRFFEILIPSPTAMNAPSIVKERGGAEQIIKWLTESPHSLVGRQWRAFYTKDAGYRKPVRELRLGPDAKAMFKDRVHFFAENGHNFRPQGPKKRPAVPPEDTMHQRTEFKASQMLDWLLQLRKNERQPHLKLFSRIQLGLSKTFPAVIFEPEQIRHRPEDKLSSIQKIMNDGIGLMSRSVAKKIRDALGLSDIPSAIQGRMGSAKGMWLMDVTDTGDADWIETYPSQRKWECDFSSDSYHRTLEVRNVPSEPKSAGLNLQFLPVLEARARDPLLMRQTIGERLIKDLERQFEGQKAAFKSPLQLRQWVAENTNSRPERVKHGHVPFLGGLPDNKGEVLNLLLNSGFDLRKQRYGTEIVWELQKLRCDVLKTKLNIKVGRSAYLYMVVDFWGVLEENEVHVGFSSKFRDELDGSSYTLLADCDVLVARSPAHFVSDVQKVRAVFKSELHALKDVIVFPSKGNIPLAEKLSGGDYDGDMAWVCWDPDIVNSFVNADVPAEPDLSAYMDKDETTFGELVRATGLTGVAAREEAVYDMIRKSFWFAMQPNYLGICTNYKEKLCYYNNSVSNNDAVILSTLVGKLVDQSKQGIIFDKTRWERLQRDLLGGRHLNDPAYKGEIWTGQSEPRHIIDYLKFTVAKPAIDRELETFHRILQADKDRATGGDGETADWWDQDLVVYYEAFKALTTDSRSYRAILEALTNSIGEVEQEWKRLMSSRHPGLTYPEKVKKVYARWCAIEPRAIGRGGSNRLDPKTAAFLEHPYLANRGGTRANRKDTSYWALLKASTAFKMYYRTSPKFVWQIAGRQLAFIKAQMMSSEQAPLLVTPLMYAASAPDGKFVKQYVARLDLEGSEYLDPEDAEFGDDDLGGEEGRVFRGDDVD